MFGMRAQKEVITMEEARDIADRLGVYIWLGGGTGQGFIGAMAGVGLRSTGNDGRFIELKGIREVKGVKSVGDDPQSDCDQPRWQPCRVRL